MNCLLKEKICRVSENDNSDFCKQLFNKRTHKKKINNTKSYLNTNNFHRDWLSFPVISRDSRTTCPDNNVYHHLCPETFESISKTNFMSGFSKDKSKNKLKSRCKEFSKKSNCLHHISNASMNCQKQQILDDNDNHNEILDIKKTDYMPAEENSILSKSISDTSLVFIFNNRECVEYFNENEVNIANIFMENVFPRENYMETKLLKHHSTQSATFSNFCKKNSMSNLLSDNWSQDKFYASKTNDIDYENLEFFDSAQYYSTDSLNIQVDKCDKRNKNPVNGNFNIMRPGIKKFDDSLGSNANPMIYKREMQGFLSRERFGEKSLHASPKLLSIASYGSNINQMGDIELTENEIDRKRDKYTSLECIYKSEKLCQRKEMPNSPSFSDTKFCQVLPAFEKMKLHATNLSRQMSTVELTDEATIYNRTLTTDLFSSNISKTGKLHRNVSQKYPGLPTSKVINGRFQHGWQCTYKSCMEFNSIKRQTCQHCLNPRLSYPPVCKRDVMCGDCGYVNYKSRLYCKKCKLIFININ